MQQHFDALSPLFQQLISLAEQAEKYWAHTSSHESFESFASAHKLKMDFIRLHNMCFSLTWENTRAKSPEPFLLNIQEKLTDVNVDKVKQAFNSPDLAMQSLQAKNSLVTLYSYFEQVM